MKTPLLAAFGALALVAGSANAAVLAIETFSYDDGQLSGKGSAGGGWGGTWTTGFGTASVIQVTSGIVSGGGSASQRMFRLLDPSVAALTNGSAANDNTTIYVGIDWEFGGAYGGFELPNGGSLRLQLGSQGTGRDLRTGSTIHVPSANFTPLSGVNRYIMAITYNNTTGDMVELFKNGVSIGASAANGTNDFSFDRVGLGLFLANTDQIRHADNLIIATTFAEAAIPEPSAAALAALGGLALLRRRKRATSF